MNRYLFFPVMALALFGFAACTPGPGPLRVHPKGPRIAHAVIPTFLKYALPKRDRGPIALSLATDVSLTTGQNLPRGALLEGHYQVNYGQVLFAPAFASYFDSAERLQRVALQSKQLGRLDRVVNVQTQSKTDQWYGSSEFPIPEETLFFLDFRL